MYLKLEINLEAYSIYQKEILINIIQISLIFRRDILIIEILLLQLYFIYLSFCFGFVETKFEKILTYLL